MHLLVVEDNARMSTLLRRGLTEEGYDVDVIGDGSQGLEMALRYEYDAVVLDVMLPGADGFEVCADLRRAGRWTPVLMLTGRDEVESRVRGLECGADAYVVKPFAFTELTARVRALVRRGTRETPESLRNGSVRIEPAARRVWNCEREVFLGPMQYEMLELFLRHPDEIFSRSRLVNEVWDFAADPRSNVVDQHIGMLRRRLQAVAAWDDLETLRGLGYRLRRVAPVVG